jgi:putative transposase
MPRIGTRKLHYMLTETLQKHNISIGRDKLFDLLEDYGLLVRRRKRKRINTTDSNHPFRKYPNLIRELQVSRPNHLWVSDITYISLADCFCYLSLVTDAYSTLYAQECDATMYNPPTNVGDTVVIISRDNPSVNSG